VLISSAVILALASAPGPGPEARAALSRDDSSQLHRAIEVALIHEAQVFGQADLYDQGDAFFGYFVAVSGDTAVVGAPYNDTEGGSQAGSAWVFARSSGTWTLQQRLVPSDAAAQDNFGWSVSISGDTVVVGAYFDDTQWGTDAGSAYVFVRSGVTWTEQQKLVPPDGAPGDWFGSAVSISGETVAVGAYVDGDLGFAAGSVYVFVRSGTAWLEEQKLLASDGGSGDHFGYAVSLSGDTLVVGSPQDNIPGGVDEGSADVFVRSGALWTHQQKLLASDPTASAGFGTSLSVSGDTLIVGAPWDDTPSADVAGSAYVFVRSGTTWTEQQKLFAPDGSTQDWFGFSTAISGDTVIVGKIEDAAQGIGTGSAYVFARTGNNWILQQKLLASDAAGNSYFGFSIAASGDTLLIGAVAANTPSGFDGGEAYAFVSSGTTWIEQQALFASDDQFGYSVSLSGDTLVVGAPYDGSPQGKDSGTADVFVRSGTTWTEQQRLFALNSSFGLFGASVSISGDTVVVGVPRDDTPGGSAVGSAYVFVRTGTYWTQQQQLIGSGGASFDGFGAAVSIAGDTVVVGAPGDDATGGSDAGSAYVFVRSGTTWTEQQKLQASDAAAFDQFGVSASVSGDTVVLGAAGADVPGGLDAGAAYVFVRSGSTWSEQQKLLASDGAAGDGFGSAVSIDADSAVVGAARGDTTGGADAGSAYVFLRAGTAWGEQQKLLASDGAAGDHFGATVSVAGETAVAGAALDDTPGGVNAGSAYVFERVGAVWTEQPKLLAPDAAALDGFGSGVAVSGDTIAVGAFLDDRPAGSDAGSAHVFRRQNADLSATKSDGQATAVPGLPITYTITISNAGPTAVAAATVTDALPAALQGAVWSCAASPGSACGTSGSGSIDDGVDLLLGGSAVYTLTATVDPGATGSIANTVVVAVAPGATDPNSANNSATDTDSLTPQADLVVGKTDGQTTAIPGALLTYTIPVKNDGPSAALGAVTDTVPAVLQGATWSCSASLGSSCTAVGAGSINDTVDLQAGGVATYKLTGTTDPAATGSLVNTVTVAALGGVSDPDLTNNSATDTDSLLPTGIPLEGELVHGYKRQHDLAAIPGPAADEDVFRILQDPHASYEILLDGASGDLGSGSGPLLDRLGADASTVVQASSAAGAGGSRTLRWINALDTPVADELVRVRSAGCTTSCDAADVYRLGALETTAFIPRFNNSGSQVTVLVLQNGGDVAVDLDVRFWSNAGAALGGIVIQALGPRQTYVQNTAVMAPGASGSITVAHTGRYGQIAGKAVAVEPATGFTFDTAAAARPR
jgi:uncharacterized repeat protein (TIGR01451 family)